MGVPQDLQESSMSLDSIYTLKKVTTVEVARVKL